MKTRSENPKEMPLKEPAARRTEKRAGFVLLVVLIVVTLVAVIVMASLLVASSAVQTSRDELRTNQARQNALFALNTALGQLQREAGPDQRVTARADILSTTLAENKYWTGVWKTYNPAVASKPPRVNTDQALDVGNNLRAWATNPSHVAWLVSNPGLATPPDPASWTATSTNSINLAYDQSTSPATTIAQAPLVNVTATVNGNTKKTGKYAYWVSDEGVKAKVNLYDPTLNTTTQAIDASNQYTQNLLHFLTPQSTATFKVLPSTLSSDFRATSGLTNVVSNLDSLKYIPTTIPTAYCPSHYLPDLTTYSFGVLSDVRNGGLKRDLTAILEDDGSGSGQYNLNFPDNVSSPLPDAQSVYRCTTALPTPIAAQSFANNNGGTTYFDGMRWRSLYFYYNLYKSVMPLNRAATGTPSVLGNTAPTGITATLGNLSKPYSIQARDYQWNDNGCPMGLDALAPVCLGMRLEFTLQSVPVGANYQLQMNNFSELIYYNPYSVQLRFSPSSYLAAQAKTMFNGSVHRTYTITANGSPVITNQDFDGGYPYSWGPGIRKGDMITLEPGEIRAFSEDQNVEALNQSELIYSNPPTTITNRALTSSDSNVSQDYGLYMPIPNAASPWSSAGDENIQVTVAPNFIIGEQEFQYDYDQLPTWPDGTSDLPLTNTGGIGATASTAWPTSGVMLSQMTTPGGYKIIGIFVRAKGINPDTDSNYGLYQDALPIFMGNSPQFNIFNTLTGAGWEEQKITSFSQYSSPTDIQMAWVPDSNGINHWDSSWGNTAMGTTQTPPTPNNIVIKDVPCQPLLSLGQFMHMNLFYYQSISYAPWYKFYYGGSMCIGGSLANTSVPTNSTGATINGQLYMDDSFLANQTLFDSFFLSTVPPNNNTFPSSLSKYYPQIASVDPNAFNPQTYPTTTTVTNPSPYIAKDKPLPNARMRYYRRNGLNPAVADLQDARKSAANLLLDGAFNINSTSISSWQALLSSLSGNGLKVWNTATTSPLTLSVGQLLNPIPRFWSITNTTTPNQAWSGQVALTDTQVQTLSTNIVNQVKARGPFLSMADFLNRRIGPTGPTTASGCCSGRD